MAPRSLSLGQSLADELREADPSIQLMHNSHSHPSIQSLQSSPEYEPSASPASCITEPQPSTSSATWEDHITLSAREIEEDDPQPSTSAAASASCSAAEVHSQVLNDSQDTEPAGGAAAAPTTTSTAKTPSEFADCSEFIDDEPKVQGRLDERISCNFNTTAPESKALFSPRNALLEEASSPEEEVKAMARKASVASRQESLGATCKFSLCSLVLPKASTLLSLWFVLVV